MSDQPRRPQDVGSPEQPDGTVRLFGGHIRLSRSAARLAALGVAGTLAIVLALVLSSALGGQSPPSPATAAGTGQPVVPAPVTSTPVTPAPVAKRTPLPALRPNAAPPRLAAFDREVSAICRHADLNQLQSDLSASSAQITQTLNSQLAAAQWEVRQLSGVRPPRDRAAYARLVRALTLHLQLMRQTVAALKSPSSSLAGLQYPEVDVTQHAHADNLAALTVGVQSAILGVGACGLQGTVLAPTPERNRTAPSGSWLATQTMGDQTLRSLWVFKRVCPRHRACVIDLVRQLIGGATDEARVTERVGADDSTVFVATFPPIRSDCLALGRPLLHPGETAQMSDEYDIGWAPSGGGLKAGVISRGGCPQSFDAVGGLSWAATRVAATPTRSATAPPQPAKTGFVPAEQSLCLAARKRVEALGRPSQYDLVGWLARTEAQISWTITKLERLHPPAAKALAVEQFVASLRSENDLIGRLRTAAVAGNTSALTALGGQLAALELTVTADAHGAGFSCGPTLPNGESPSSVPNCGADGVDAGGEGICTSSNLDGNGEALLNVVDAGHTLHMPGYDLRLLATRVVSTRVTNPSVSPGDYPGGRGSLVSFKVAVTNTTSAPLDFDVKGKDTQLLTPHSTPTSAALSTFEIVNPNSGPGIPIADESPIAPHATVTGWISFVAPRWTPSVLHARTSDLVVFPLGDTSGDYLGELRLWKWANAQGRTALGLPATARIPASPPAATTA